ncbi:MAG TPA: rod shape-determining protein MreC [Gammaproteobacteria bacterium]|nr:rod shape-determining protein MreC [Gammaproteobacteria bacterium]
MLRFTRERRLFHPARGQALRSFVLALAAIALMTVDYHYGTLAVVRDSLSVVVYPAKWLVNAPSAAWREVSTDLSGRVHLLAENRRLHRELLLAQSRLERLDSLAEQNRRLQMLLNAAAAMPGRVLATSVLEVDLNPFENVIVVNAGQGSGVRKGQPVLDAYGIVGQVLDAGPLSSRVLLITDPASAVPVEIERTGLATLALGTGNLDRLSLPYLPNNTDVRPGDHLLSSGLGGRYPRGYPVGIVISVKSQPEQRFAQVIARPFAHLGREHEMLIYSSGSEPKAPP